MALPPSLRPARSTTTSCRPRCGSSSGARRSRPSRFRRCRPMAGWRSSRPTIRRCSRSAGSGRATSCTCRRAARSRARSPAGARHRQRCSRCATARSSIRGRCSSAATCSAARSRIATSARSSTRRQHGDAGAARAPIWSRRRSKCCASRRCRATRTSAISSGVLLLDGDETASRRCAPADEPGLQVLAGADRHQELLPPQRRRRDAVPRQPRRHRPRHRRDRALREGAASHRPGPARRAVRDRLPAARDGHRRQPQRLHRAQPVARDQGLRRRRRDVQLPQRALAPARRPGEVRDVGARGRQSGARRTAVPDRARSGRRARRARCSSCCATRRASLPQLVAPAIARRAARQAGATCRLAVQLLHMLRGRSAVEPRPGGARRPGAHRRRDRDGRHRPAARRRRHPAARRAGRSRTRPSPSKARARRRRWRRAASARCSRSARTG